jgi:hypothetical protein
LNNSGFQYHKNLVYLRPVFKTAQEFRTTFLCPKDIAQRSSFCEVASVRQGDGALRHDARDSDVGNLPKAKAGTPAAATKAVLGVARMPPFILARLFSLLAVNSKKSAHPAFISSKEKVINHSKHT